MADDFQNFEDAENKPSDAPPDGTIAEVANPPSDEKAPVHEPVPDDAVAEAPDDHRGLMGYYRRAAGDEEDLPKGSTVVVKLDASPSTREVYERKGFIFCGYTHDDA